MKYLSILLLSLSILGCGPEVKVTKQIEQEITSEAIFNDFEAYELCPDEQIEFLCKECIAFYPETNGYCAVTFEDKSTCWAGYKWKKDLDSCIDKVGLDNVEKCTICK